MRLLKDGGAFVFVEPVVGEGPVAGVRQYFGRVHRATNAFGDPSLDVKVRHSVIHSVILIDQWIDSSSPPANNPNADDRGAVGERRGQGRGFRGGCGGGGARLPP